MFILKNGIFMPPGLKEKFDKLDELSWMALTEHQNNKQHKFIPAQRDALTEFLNVGGPLMKELEAEVKQRLWGSAL